MAPILFGLAIALTDLYPKWLGWVAVVGAVSMGIVLFLKGLSLAGTIGFTAFGAVVTVSLLVMGCSCGAGLVRRPNVFGKKAVREPVAPAMGA